ncbi:DUF6412 domain-containing protein [Streptomyces sp. NPDC005989]|uniref:DUF6412 domain-containing protein n=1 Tax=Streptomyces sp. NPDC005989 TaxID=3156727 RepID=UPI00340ACE92
MGRAGAADGRRPPGHRPHGGARHGGAAAGSALAVASVISARCAAPVPRTRVRTAIRDREKRTAFLPQRDPDAKGRRRPRAPGRALPTAA